MLMKKNQTQFRNILIARKKPQQKHVLEQLRYIVLVRPDPLSVLAAERFSEHGVHLTGGLHVGDESNAHRFCRLLVFQLRQALSHPFLNVTAQRRVWQGRRRIYLP